MTPGSRRERGQRLASPAPALGRVHLDTAHQPQTLPTGTITFLFTDVEGQHQRMGARSARNARGTCPT